MSQRARARLVVTLTDDEDWPWDDEVGEFQRTETDELDDIDQEATLLEFDECVGDELRMKGSVTISLEADRRVRFEGRFRLFEGQSCSTVDPEGPGFSFERVLGPNRARTVNLILPGDGGGSAAGTVRLSNRTLP